MKRGLYWADPKLMEPGEDEGPYLPSPVEANLVGSKLANGKHAPVIDIDHPCWVVPSSTPGHYHLYIDKEVEWDKYEKVLDALAEAGIIGPWYNKFSKEQQETVCRLPWVKKGHR